MVPRNTINRLAIRHCAACHELSRRSIKTILKDEISVCMYTKETYTPNIPIFPVYFLLCFIYDTLCVAFAPSYVLIYMYSLYFYFS